MVIVHILECQGGLNKLGWKEDLSKRMVLVDGMQIFAHPLKWDKRLHVDMDIISMNVLPQHLRIAS